MLVVAEGRYVSKSKLVRKFNLWPAAQPPLGQLLGLIMEMLEDCNGEAGTLAAEIAKPSNATIQTNQCIKRFSTQPLKKF